MKNILSSRFLKFGLAIFLVAAVFGVPAATIASNGPVEAHHFWGHVATSGGQPAANVEVTAWINGEQRGNISTDESGQYGMPEYGYHLAVTGNSGDIITFRVDGIVAEETRLGVDVETDNGNYEWQWQDLEPAWEAVYESGAVNGLDLVYNPPPAKITNLATSGATTNSITLTWTAPGDDDNQGTASQYDIRYLQGAAITDANWASATQCAGEPSPKVAGSNETFTVGGLAAGTTYFFAIKTADEVLNWSAISNSPSGTTTTITEDSTPPAKITNLATSEPTTNSITLTWTAPGDDGNQGTASQYDIRYLEGATITDANWASATPCAGQPSPQLAGSSETFTVGGLAAGTTYFFAIKTADEVLNWSAISNCPSGTTTTITTGGGGGGGASAPSLKLTVNLPEGITKSGEISTRGVLLETIAVSAPDMVGIIITKGTEAKTIEGERLKLIEVVVMQSPPSPVSGKSLVGPVYDFKPKGASFNPYIEVTLNYNPAEMEENVDAESLAIACYDEGESGWVPMDSTIDSEAYAVTAQVSHFTPFAILGSIVTPPPVVTTPEETSSPTAPPPPPSELPAAFTVGNLQISPNKLVAGSGKSVFITVDITNTGEAKGSYTVELRVNGTLEDTLNITVAGGKTETAGFYVVKDTVGSYKVEVDGQSATFTVIESEAEPEPTRWILIAWIVGGMVVLGLVVYFVRRLFFYPER